MVNGLLRMVLWLSVSVCINIWDLWQLGLGTWDLGLGTWELGIWEELGIKTPRWRLGDEMSSFGNMVAL